MLEREAGPDTTPTPLPKAPPPGSTTESIPDGADPRRVGELLNEWLAIRMAEVDALVDEAESKVATIPDQRRLWLLIGELVVRLHCLELEAAELRKAVKR